jgi:hypothetical protein
VLLFTKVAQQFSPAFHPLGDFLNPALVLLGQGLSVTVFKIFLSSFSIYFFNSA